MFKVALITVTVFSGHVHHTYFHDEASCEATRRWMQEQVADRVRTVCAPLEAGRLESGVFPLPDRKPARRE